jgi:hypothetical protein
MKILYQENQSWGAFKALPKRLCSSPLYFSSISTLWGPLLIIGFLESKCVLALLGSLLFALPRSSLK